MNHNVRRSWWQYLETTTPMHVGSQRPLVGQLPNMHGQHPEPAKGPSITFAKVLGLLLGHHARADVTPLPWPPETAFVVAAGHCNCTLQA